MNFFVDISQAARRDFVKQYAWYAKPAGEAIAERFSDEFLATTGRLQRTPQMG